MIIQEDTAESNYIVKAYSPGKITVNKNTYTQSLIISRTQLIADWSPQNLEQLSDLTKILELKAEIVLLGTGKKFKIPNPSLLTQIRNQGIGIEYMDTGAACRTFNALASEGRNVVAALLIE